MEEELNPALSYMWFGILENTEGLVIEIGPGSGTEPFHALNTVGFKGKYRAIEPEPLIRKGNNVVFADSTDGFDWKVLDGEVLDNKFDRYRGKTSCVILNRMFDFLSLDT